MNDELPVLRPASRSILLARSLQLSETAATLFGLGSAAGAIMFVIAILTPSIWLALLAVPYGVGGGALAYRATRISARMRRVWREGERVEVTVTDCRLNYSYWRATIVEYQGRHAEVMFRRAPAIGAKLPALICGDSIAVLEPIGCLRLGWLS